MIDLTILSTAHHVSDARLHRISRAATAAGLEVEVCAHGKEEDAPADVKYRGPQHRPGLLSRFGRATIAAATAQGRTIMVIDPDLIVPSWFWARLRRRKLVVDVHEDYEAVTYDRPWTRGVVGRAARVAVRVAMGVAARADLTVVADEHLDPRLARHRVIVGHHPAVTGTTRSMVRDPQPRAIYIGDVRPSRGLWWMLEALAEAPDWSLDIIGRISEIPRGTIDRVVQDLGISDRVRFHGQQPPHRSWATAQGAWCGLALLDETPAYRAAIPTKVLEYLAAGLPVLASPLPRVRALLGETQAGITVGSVADAATRLRQWGRDPVVVQEMARAGMLWVDSRASNFDPFDDVFLELLLPMSRRTCGDSVSEDRTER